MSLFDTEFSKLNPAQREAVTTTDGPVLVVAGPGTGKTQLLSMRVANILRQGNVDASNILCLTFTNKAATNMRDRLLRLVGPESNKVTVKTFHGFAAEFMNANPDNFWNGAKLSTAPDAVQLDIVQSILAALPLSNPLSIRFAGQYTATSDVIKALRLTKEAGLTPEKLRSMLEINLAYIDLIEPQMVDMLSATLSVKRMAEIQAAVQTLPAQGIDATVAPLLSLSTVIQESFAAALAQDEGTGKTKNVGKWKSRWVQTHDGVKGMHDERKRNTWWQAFAEVYEKYRNNLHSNGYYDYSDMLLEVIIQLEQSADLRAEAQERYQYVLIDEFQDSNAAQLRLAHLVADHHTAEGAPNIMAVGDDDQSIFGFNGAELNNMLFFNRNYDTTKSIVLEDNYRSSQAILDVSDAVIQQAEDRLVNRIEGLSKKLTAKNEPSTPGAIQHVSYKTQEHQYSQLSRFIKDLYTSNESESIAVLARSHESLKQLSSILLSLDLPIKYEQQTNVLDHDIVKQVILICEAVSAISNGNIHAVNEKVSHILRHPMWGIQPAQLWSFASHQFTNRNSDWLTMLQQSDDLKAQQIASWLQWLASVSSHQPLGITLEQILGLTTGQHITSPLREYYIDKQDITADYLHGLSAVRLLRQLVNEFTNGEKSSLEDLIDFIAINQENNRGITDESAFVTGGRAIELLTVHKAKGLEFDQVIIVDAVEDNWKSRNAGRKAPANLPLQAPGEKDDDYIRLLYVAFTRAKRALYVASYQHDASGKEVLATPYVRQAIPIETAPKQYDVTPVQVLEENLRWPRLTAVDEKALLKQRLTDYNLSATHLLTFLNVANAGPQIFLERHILRLPQSKTAAQGFGIAIHSALQFAQKLTNQEIFSIEPVLKEYERALTLEHLDEIDTNKYLVHGKDVLTKLFSEEYRLKKGGQAEQYFRDIRLGEALIGGTLDLIETTPTSLIISDYKTGQPLNNFATRDQTKAIKAWRHKSQLIFYATLAKNHPTLQKNGAKIKTQMIYVEVENAKDLIRPYHPQAEEIDRMERLIQAVWRKIINLDLPDTNHYSDDITGITQFEDDLINGII